MLEESSTSHRQVSTLDLGMEKPSFTLQVIVPRTE